MKRTGRVSRAAFAVGMAVSFILAPGWAGATTYYSGFKAKTGALSDVMTWYTDEACTIAADPQPTVTTNVFQEIGTYVFLDSGKIQNRPTFLEGTHVYFGTDGVEIGSKVAAYTPNCNSVNWNCPDATIFGFSWTPNYMADGQLLGNYRLVKTSKEIMFGASSLKAGALYGTKLAGTFTGESDVMVTVASSGSAGTARVIFSGDFSGYKGRFQTTAVDGSSTATNLIWFASATSMGDPETPFDDAVTLRHRACLRIDEAVTQTAARGITLDLSAGQFVWLFAPANVAWTLRAPQYGGATGTLKKAGGGKVTLAGTMSATDILVEEGTLVVSNGASFAANTVLTVAPGATLVNMTGWAVPNVTVNVADGGTLEEVPLSLVVPFDGTDTTPLDLASWTAADRVALVKPVEIALSQTIPLPFSETNRLPLATFDGTAGFTAEDFTDVTAKTLHRLPTTWLEAETADGTTTLYLVARPAVRYIYDTAKNNARLGGSANWSDGELPHAGKDYYDTAGSNLRTGAGSAIQSYSFNGESFTYTGTISDYAQNAYFKCLRMRGDNAISVAHASSKDKETGQIVYNPNYWPRIFRGLFDIDASATDSNPAIIAADVRTEYADLAAELTGNGTLQLRTAVASEANGGLGIYPYYFTGMNTNFAGRLDLRTEDSKYVMDMYVTNGLAFGGALAAYSADAVRVRPKSAAVDGSISITAMADTTVDAANRGWIATSVTLGASNGVTFVFAPPTLTLGTKLRKTGGGTLALGCATIGGGTAFAVEEGYVKALSGDCCTNLDLAVSAGAGLKADLAPADPVVAAKGLVAKSILPAAEGGSILVAPDLPADFEEPGSFTAVVCTVPASQADLSSVLTAHPVANYRGTVVKDSETFAEEGLVVYSAVWRMTGMTIIIK